jgi:diguanylate cyclase (GGDEF)-like protein
VVLRVVAASIQRMLRPIDTLARYGGDEFVILCPHTSPRNGLILAERLRRSIGRIPFSATQLAAYVVGAAYNLTRMSRLLAAPA